MLTYGIGAEDLSRFLAEDPVVWADLKDWVDDSVARWRDAPTGVNADVGYFGEENRNAAQEKANRLGQLASSYLQLPLVESADPYPAQQDVATIHVFGAPLALRTATTERNL